MMSKKVLSFQAHRDCGSFAVDGSGYDERKKPSP